MLGKEHINRGNSQCSCLRSARPASSHSAAVRVTNTGRFPVKAALSVRHPLPDPGPLPPAAAALPPASPRAAHKGGKAAKAAVPPPPPAPLPPPPPNFSLDVTVLPDMAIEYKHA